MSEDVIIGRQPIFDRDGNVAAFELLFRANRAHGNARIANADEATLRVILNTFHEIGLKTLVGRLPAYINLTEGFLTGAYELAFPRHQVVLEVLESVALHEPVIAALRALAARGYTIALDDFVYDAQYARLLDVVDVVKIDVKALDRGQVREQVRLLAGHDLTLLAEKIETATMLDFCRGLGFDLFQGYHLAYPETIASVSNP